jgi:outer membrane receptor protein involved in Fe transport
MYQFNHVARGAAFLIAFWAAADSARAQTAQITGRITDTSAAVVPGATVTVTNIATGVPRTAVSNAEGYYAVPALQPGRYRALAELAGFSPASRDAITLVADQTARLDFVLAVGTLTEDVRVVGGAELLESETATFGTIVTERSIRELPLNVRDPMALVTLTPGVVTGTFFGGGGSSVEVGRNFFKSDFKVGGGRPNGQDILLDGAPNTTGDRNFMAYIPPVDATQEFKVVANGFSAEYGRTTGGIVTIVTRSGSNALTGTAYEFHRNSSLDANGFFGNLTGQPSPDFQRNQFGGAVGGPVRRERTFFFGTFEGLRQTFPETLISTVPTQRQRAGDFSETFDSQGRLIVIHDPLTTTRLPNGQLVRTPFPGNVIPPERHDPVARAAAAFYPEPNQPGTPITGANNYVNTSESTVDSNNYSLRIDHNLNAAHKLFGRYSYYRSDNQRALRWDGPGARDARVIIDQYYNVTLGSTHIFSSSLTGELRTAFARAHANQVSPEFDVSQLGLPGNFLEVAPNLFPHFNLSDVTSLGSAAFNDQPRNTYSVLGAVTKLTGRHQLKFGFDYRVLQFNAFQNNNASGAFTFSRGVTQGPNPLQARPDAGHGFASFLLGAGTGGEIEHISGLALQRRYYAFYVQDDWKITPRVTLNAGLRYDLTTGQTERQDRLTWMDLGARSPFSDLAGMELKGLLQYAGTNGNPRNQIDTDRNNFGPRLGFAYRASDNTVVRAGYGIFYVPMIVLGVGSIGFNSSTPWVASIDGLVPENYLRNPFPQGLRLPTDTRDPLANVGFGISGYIRDEPVGYTQQWNVSIQRQLGRDLIVDIAYLGNKGTNLQFADGFEQNSLPTEHLALGPALNERVPNPFFGVIATGALSGTTVARRQLLLPFPQYTSVFRNLPMAASSIYHGLATKVERRMGEGLTLLGSYTWSKHIDDSSAQEGFLDPAGGVLNVYDLRAERSISAYDTPHRLVVSAVYDLPFGRDRRLGRSMSRALDALAGGWTFSGIGTFQSGTPLIVSRPALRDTRSAKLDTPTIDRWFDTSAFAPAAPFTFGNVGRLQADVRNDGIRNVDVTLSKYLRFADRFRLQVRVDAFNAFNRPQFGRPNGTVTSPSFGRITTQANSPREIQLGIKFYW